MLRPSCFAVIAAVAAFTLASVSAAAAEPLAPPVRSGDLAIKLTPIASGLVAPNWGAAAPGRPGVLFVTDQVGIVWAVELATGSKSVFLDVQALLVPLGILGPGTFDERGLLGLAFDPDYARNGRLYTFTTEPAGSPPDFTTLPGGVPADSQSVIREWIVPAPADPASTPSASRVLLRIDKPQFNHNGGAITFGPDGHLYVSVGDGGSADDLDTDRGGPLFFGVFPTVGHGDGNGQQPRNPLGKILRIDPRGTSAPNGQYAIPGDNPFVKNGGDGPLGGAAGCTADGFCDEIWAFGFRNPFRMSFDRHTGKLWLGDVGQNNLEEVDIVVRGGNYGWPRKEGSAFFTPNGPDGVGVASRIDPGNLPRVIDPVAEYGNPFDGRAVIGGFVYRGAASPRLRGVYVFGDFTRVFDFATGNLSEGRLFFLSRGERGPRQRLAVSEFQLFDASCSVRLPKLDGARGLSVLGFGEDARGEIYLLANATGVPGGQTGVVRRIDSCD
jgi:glucose/arabinose dehydrogenase